MTFVDNAEMTGCSSSHGEPGSSCHSRSFHRSAAPSPAAMPAITVAGGVFGRSSANNTAGGRGRRRQQVRVGRGQDHRETRRGDQRRSSQGRGERLATKSGKDWPRAVDRPTLFA